MSNEEVRPSPRDPEHVNTSWDCFEAIQEVCPGLLLYGEGNEQSTSSALGKRILKAISREDFDELNTCLKQRFALPEGKSFDWSGLRRHFSAVILDRELLESPSVQIDSLRYRLYCLIHFFADPRSAEVKLALKNQDRSRLLNALREFQPVSDKVQANLNVFIPELLESLNDYPDEKFWKDLFNPYRAGNNDLRGCLD